ncbi:MAG: CxxxxCH/CxxCH domain-containing protein [Polyangiaceae bacterium]|nr:CxxxxCH/CxxCH domain-containing protein [Polyangiaceae bacterium]
MVRKSIWNGRFQAHIVAAAWIGSAILVAACVVEREVDRDGGVHREGFAEPETANFHGTSLRAEGYPLEGCRLCHGDDYKGGPVGFSCTTSGCHTSGVEWCGTCHQGASPPEPSSGAHEAHPGACSDCHPIPKDAREPKHPSGVVDVILSGQALMGGAKAMWDATARRCANTYCHGATSPPWEPLPGSLECGACHAAPPLSHARFPVDPAPEGCASCHPIPPEMQHIDGKIDFIEPSCDTCHGKGEGGAPPPGLDGSTSPSAPGVGAHQSHLDETLANRIGRTVACVTCHDVPASALSPGHLDDGAPADVRFFQGSYDVEARSCVVGCHWDKNPGPVWTDMSGAEKACDACHGFPPVKTRKGTPHPASQPDQLSCISCHSFEIDTHVDGHVDFLP